MKIINITKTKYLCELSKEELDAVTAQALYKDDYRRLFINETEFDIVNNIRFSAIREEGDIKRAIESLNSASKFLQNRFSMFESIEKLKG